jgi:tripartite-type tricarboxylate transporter receptor subunit TctC
MRKTLVLLAAAAACAAQPGLAAQPYPTRPVRLVVTFPPGGGADIMARILAPKLTEAFGQTVIVDNRGGAGGALGSEIVARSEPDGYTVAMVSSSYAASAAYRKLPYDPVKGIQPIALLGTTGLVLVVHPSVPVKSVKELVAYARAHPGKLNYSTVGEGSVTHLAHELFRLETKTNLVHIPYKGGGPALQAAIAGETQLTMISIVPTLPHVKAGRLRAIGYSYTKRSELLPDVPPISDTVPGFEVIHWYGIWGPKGIPRDIVMRWNREVAKILLSEEMARRLKSEGLDAAGGPPEELGEIIERAVRKWMRVMKEAKIQRVG